MVWNKVQLIDIFPQTSNGQKPVDMFLANLKTVDMFLAAILRTGTKNDYLFRFLVPFPYTTLIDSNLPVQKPDRGNGENGKASTEI